MTVDDLHNHKEEEKEATRDELRECGTGTEKRNL